MCDVFSDSLSSDRGVGKMTLLAVRRGTDRHSLVTLTRYKAANIENEYSGAVPPFGGNPK